MLRKQFFLSSFCVVLLLLFSNAVKSQTKTVTGKIINSESKEPVIGATVKVKGGNYYRDNENPGARTNWTGDAADIASSKGRHNAAHIFKIVAHLYLS